jgi:hypothetical protein
VLENHKQLVQSELNQTLESYLKTFSNNHEKIDIIKNFFKKKSDSWSGYSLDVMTPRSKSNELLVLKDNPTKSVETMENLLRNGSIPYMDIPTIKALASIYGEHCNESDPEFIKFMMVWIIFNYSDSVPRLPYKLSSVFAAMDIRRLNSRYLPGMNTDKLFDDSHSTTAIKTLHRKWRDSTFSNPRALSAISDIYTRINR